LSGEVVRTGINTYENLRFVGLLCRYMFFFVEMWGSFVHMWSSFVDMWGSFVYMWGSFVDI